MGALKCIAALFTSWLWLPYAGIISGCRYSLLLRKLFGYPRLVSIYMQAHFEYVTDIIQFNQQDYWQSAKEMFARERGDCEDWAAVAYALLDPGYNAFLFRLDVEVGGVKAAHVGCGFSVNGEFRAIDTRGYLLKGGRTEGDLYPEVATRVYGNTVTVTNSCRVNRGD